MSTSTTTATTPTRRTNGWLIAAAVPMAIVGALNVVGSFIFSFPGGDLEGFVVGSLVSVMGIGIAVSGVLVARGSDRAVPFAVGLLLVDGAWNAWKVLGEGETESTMFLVGIAVAGILLAAGLARHRQRS